MSSLTGNEIQNSYQGLLKTENNGALPVDRTYITDGEGNGTGMYFWKQYATLGMSNQGQPNVSPYLEVQNFNFDLSNSPMASNGTTNFGFTDTNGSLTYSISQNRFGGINYYNTKDGQPHIFQGLNSNSRIEMDFFNNNNNSDNWYTGYNQSVTDLQVSGSDLTLTRQGTAPLSVTLPSGGGGGFAVPGTTDDLKVSNFMRTSFPVLNLIYTAEGDSFETADLVAFVPIDLQDGNTMDELAFNIKNFTSNGTATCGLYTSDSNGRPSTLISGTETTLSITSTGWKFLSGLNWTLSGSANGRYYVAIQQEGGNFRFGKLADARRTASMYDKGRLALAPGYTGLLNWQQNNTGALPASVDFTSTSGSDKARLILFR